MIVLKIFAAPAAAALAAVVLGYEGFSFTAWVLERRDVVEPAEGLNALTALFLGAVVGVEAAVATLAAVALGLAGKRRAARIVVWALVVVLVGEHATLLVFG